VATAISVCVMILATALFDGFKQAINTKFYNCWGHIHIMNFDATGTSFRQVEPLQLDSNLLNNIAKDKNVKSITAFSIQSIVLKTNKGLQGLLLKGVSANYDWQTFNSFITQGKSIQYNDSTYSKDIMLSTTQAAKLNLKAGDSVIAYFVLEQGDVPRARKLRVCGLYETGLQENDKLFAVVDAALIKRLTNDSLNNIFGYELKVNNLKQVDEINKQLQDKYLQLPLQSYTINQRFDYVYQWLSLIEKDLNIVYIIMLIVAIINIISGVLILIMERTQMVGTLKSIGANNASIRSIFVWQSIYISIIGISCGVILALILGLWQQYFPIVKLDAKVYYVKTVQVSFVWWKVAGIALGTLIVMAILLVIPTIIIKRITPLKALQFD
jgi:lipoprotein-releasing system permease protein